MDVSTGDVAVRLRLKALFTASIQSTESRSLVKKLREEGIIISRWRAMKIIREEVLVCLQRRASYKVMTKPRPGAEVAAPNLLKDRRRLAVFSGD